MSVSSSRPFAASGFPQSPAGTTVSSLNYSQYGQTPFASSSRSQQPPSVPSSSYSGPASRANLGNSGRSGQAPSGGGGASSGSRKLDSREVARIHWKALREFLHTWLKDESPSARASAREKLTRLTKLQFQELSTDVYDELMRRLSAERGAPEDAVPFLPVRDDFHPKRNQARQKLATLPKNRFKDLASDVYYELKRRYPEFEQEQDDQEPYTEPPAPGPAPLRNPYTSTTETRPIQNGPDRRGNPTPPPINRLGSNSSMSHHRSASRQMSNSSVHTHRSNPSRDGRMEPRSTGLNLDREGLMEQLDNDDRPQASLAATNHEVVVPNKSRLREEDIEVPYARDSVMEPGSRSDSRTGRGSRADSRQSYRAGDRDSRVSNSTSTSVMDRNRTPRDDRGPRVEPNEVLSPNLTNDDREYYDRMSFSSNVTNKSKIPNGAATAWDEDKERKIRSEYELRIAGLERRAATAEKERDEMKKAIETERERKREYEDEVRGLKERSNNHASSLRSLQHELDIARDAAQTAKKHAEQSSRNADDEVSSWRDRCESLEDEIRRLEDEKAHLEANAGQGNTSNADVTELRSELQSLVEELNALSQRNDELMTEREADAAGMNEMEAKVEEYKKKYDAARIELRNLKATSTMFVAKPLSDDHLPASPDGNIADINVSAFQSAIDSILSAARSSAPTGVLPAMKAVVEAITDIGEDVKAFEAAPNIDVDASRLESLKHESTTRLSNLMQAARNHAMSSGLSPVSLLDAAAGHLSANIVQLIKLLKIRRTIQRRRSSLSIKEMVGRDAGKANDSFNREYGVEERLREPSNGTKKAFDQYKLSSNDGSRSGTPIDRSNGPSPANNMISPSTAPAPQLRINSFQSASSHNGRMSDAFDLERQASVTSNSERFNPRAVLESRNDYRDNHERDRAPSSASRTVGGGPATPYDDRHGAMSRSSEHSATSESSAAGPATAKTNDQDRYGYRPSPVVEAVHDEEEMQFGPGGDEGEWEELKPYLNTQSSALVNSIQNLLAAIRTGNQSPQLNEHLSEVIAIASSIVAVAGNALPAGLRGEGDILLRDLIQNTNKLSEAQESAKHGGFEKNLRQGIASASFGVAKSLKSLMKLGNE